MGAPIIDLDDRVDEPTGPARAVVQRWLAGAVVVVLASAVAVLWSARPSVSVGSAVQLGVGGITAFGTLALTDPDSGFVDVGAIGITRPCVGSGAYADLKPGAQLTVSAGGTVLSTGRLNGGLTSPGGSCGFAWAAVHVPTGLGRYTLTLADRGSVEVDEAALRAEIALAVSAPAGRLALPGPLLLRGGPSASDIAVFGVLLTVDPAANFVRGTPCTGTGHNSDVGPGTELVVTAAGTTVASGRLGAGRAVESDGCSFAWTLTGRAVSDSPVLVVSVAGHAPVTMPAGVVPGTFLLDTSGRLLACTTDIVVRC